MVTNKFFLSLNLFVLLFIASDMLPANNIRTKNEELIKKIRVGDYNRAKVLIKEGADLNYQEKRYGYTPLMLAIRGERLSRDLLIDGVHLDFASYLISNGANVNLTTKEGYSAVHYAASTLFLTYGLDYTSNGKFMIPAYNSIYGISHKENSLNKKYLILLKRLFSKNANFNQSSRIDILPIHLAALSNSFEIFKYIYDKTNLEDLYRNNNHSVLLYSVKTITKKSYKEKYRIIEYLVRNIDSVNKGFPVLSFNKTYALNEAVDLGDVKLIELFLKNGANPNLRRILYVDKQYDLDFSPPLKQIVGGNMNAKVKIAKLLIKNGAKISYVDSNGWTLLHYAALRSDFEMTKFFIEKNIDNSLKTFKIANTFEIKKYNINKKSLTAKVISKIVLKRNKKLLLRLLKEKKMTENLKNIKELRDKEVLKIKKYFKSLGYFREIKDIENDIKLCNYSLKKSAKVYEFLSRI